MSNYREQQGSIRPVEGTEPEVLKMYAKHYKTGEVIPDSLIEKILNQKTFNQGFMTTELLAAAILDMNLHNLTDTEGLDVVAYEKEAMDQLGLIPEIAPRYRTTYFNHIIGGYAAGYYSYLCPMSWTTMPSKLSRNTVSSTSRQPTSSARMFWKKETAKTR